tara:strand:+ start:2672 stop:4171 length:1500 start_codon:yes stop_codon:yes gene_type:complete
MSQVTDYNIANASGASVRTDLNAVFDAIKTLNSGSSDPSNTEAFMPFVDTGDGNKLKIRNSSNNGFTTIGPVDTPNLGLLATSGGTLTGALQLPVGSATAPSINFGQTNTGIFKGSSNNRVSFTSAGTQVFFVDSNGININSSKEVRWKDSNNTQYIGLKAPSNITNNFTLTLPDEDGTSGQALITNGSGTLSFASPNSGAADLTGNTLASGVTASSLTSVGILNGLIVKDASGSDPTATFQHSNIDVLGEVFRIARTDSEGIRYHSIKAQSSSTQSNNLISFHLHDGSGNPFTGQQEVLKLQGNKQVSIPGTLDVTNNITAAKAQVNSIIPKNGLPSGASGGIIQIVQTLKTDAFSTTSASFVDITGMSLTITPQSSTSKILIDVIINNGAKAGSIGGVRVLRGSTPVGISTAVSSNRVNATFSATATNNATVNTFGAKFIDSPATTSATTYKLQVYISDHIVNTGSFHLNRTQMSDSEDSDRMIGAISSITAYEVTV